MTRKSAGGVVIGNNGMVVVVNQHNDSWSLPKGRVDPGESDEQTALREIREETGLSDVIIVTKLGSYKRPRIGKGGTGDAPGENKHITLF